MKPFSIYYGMGPVYAAAIICCFFLFTAQAVARGASFQIQTPPHWHNRTDRLDNDLKQQVMAPGKEAFIEVYAVRSGNIGVQAIADSMEQTMRNRGKAFLQNRISSKTVVMWTVIPASFGNIQGITTVIRCRPLPCIPMTEARPLRFLGYTPKTRPPGTGKPYIPASPAFVFQGHMHPNRLRTILETTSPVPPAAGMGPAQGCVAATTACGSFHPGAPGCT